MEGFLAILFLSSVAFALPAPEPCNQMCNRIYIPICGHNGTHFNTFGNPCEMENANCEAGLNGKTLFREVPTSTGECAECNGMCTMDYAPVCVGKGQDMRTFPNECAWDNENCRAAANGESFYEFLAAGECPEVKRTPCPTMCPMNYAPVCGHNGVAQKQFGNKCAFNVANCQADANDEPLFELISESECPTKETKKECGTICTREYVPLCGHNGTAMRNFGNQCEMNNTNCRLEADGESVFDLIFTGECPVIQNKRVRRSAECNDVCNMDYSPVCGHNGYDMKTFPNECAMKNENCRAAANNGLAYDIIFTGECPVIENKRVRSSAPKKCNTMCTDNYEPICGHNGYDMKTYPNECEMENENCQAEASGKPLYDIIFTGECPVIENKRVRRSAPKECNTMCTDNYEPICGHSGYDMKTYPNECAMDNENCQAEASGKPLYDIIFTGECPVIEKKSVRSAPKEECDTMCPMVYQPLCADNGVTRKTFGNECELKIINCAAENNGEPLFNRISNGECPGTVKQVRKPSTCNDVCLTVYDPICASNGSGVRTFNNRCEMDNENCRAEAVKEPSYEMIFAGRCP